MNYDERTLAAYLTDMMDGKVAAEATARAAGLTAEETARVAALAEKAEMVAGTYTGDGASSRTIELGFTPRAVLVMQENGQTGGSYDCYGGLALPDNPVRFYNMLAFQITSEGISVYIQSNGSRSANVNAANQKYHYLALK